MSAIARNFDFSGYEIRMILIDGQPWWVAKDVCAALGISKYRDAVAGLDDDERVSAPVDTPGGRQQMVLVSLPGLFALMLVSRSPQVRPFRRWVTHDVLPAIQETGSYSVAPPQPAALLPDMSTPEGRLAVAEMLADGARREIAVGIERDQARAELVAVQPKVDYVTGFVDAEEDASILRVFAGQVGTTEPKLRAFLKEHKVLSRRTVESRWSQSKGRMEPVYEWLARSQYRTWFVPKDQPEAPRLHNGQMRTTLYVTPVGKVGIRRLLMKHPIEPETVPAKARTRGRSA